MKIFPIYITDNNKKNIHFASEQNPIQNSKGDSFKADSFEYTPMEQAKIIHTFTKRINKIARQLARFKKSNPDDYKEQDTMKNFIAKSCISRENQIVYFNPKTDFLYDEEDDEAKTIEKQQKLNKHPEIIPFESLPKIGNEIFCELWCNEDFFVINRTSSGNYLDTSYVLNQENYERLKRYENLTYKGFMKLYDFSMSELQRYLQDGLLKSLTLRNYEDDTENQVFIIDPADETNKKGLKRHYELAHLPQKSPFINNTRLTGKYLANLGFGTEEEIIKGIRERKIAGNIYNVLTKEGIRKEARVMPESQKSQEYLKKLRDENHNIVDLMSFAKLAKIGLTQTEDAILNKEIQVIPHFIFPEDENKLLINLKNSNNARFLQRKKFEQAIIKGECDKTDNLKLKLAFSLCPKTKEIGNRLLKEQPKFKALLKEETENQLLSWYEAKPRQEFSDKLWAIAGEEEYENAILRINKALITIRKFGAEKIKDTEVKELIKQLKPENETI